MRGVVREAKTVAQSDDEYPISLGARVTDAFQRLRRDAIRGGTDIVDVDLDHGRQRRRFWGLQRSIDHSALRRTPMIRLANLTLGGRV